MKRDFSITWHWRRTTQGGQAAAQEVQGLNDTITLSPCVSEESLTRRRLEAAPRAWPRRRARSGSQTRTDTGHTPSRVGVAAYALRLRAVRAAPTEPCRRRRVPSVWPSVPAPVPVHTYMYMCMYVRDRLTPLTARALGWLKRTDYCKAVLKRPNARRRRATFFARSSWARPPAR